MSNGNTIHKPDANPILALVLSVLLVGLGHLVPNGQQRKFLFNLLATLAGTCACILPGLVIAVLSIVDSYQTAQRLQIGRSSAFLRGRGTARGDVLKLVLSRVGYPGPSTSPRSRVSGEQARGRPV